MGSGEWAVGPYDEAIRGGSIVVGEASPASRPRQEHPSGRDPNQGAVGDGSRGEDLLAGPLRAGRAERPVRGLWRLRHGLPTQRARLRPCKLPSGQPGTDHLCGPVCPWRTGLRHLHPRLPAAWRLGTGWRAGAARPDAPSGRGLRHRSGNLACQGHPHRGVRRRPGRRAGERAADLGPGERADRGCAVLPSLSAAPVGCGAVPGHHAGRGAAGGRVAIPTRPIPWPCGRPNGVGCGGSRLSGPAARRP
jgi:hypothetical protein